MKLEEAIPNLDYHVMKALWGDVLEHALETVGKRNPGLSWRALVNAVSGQLEGDEDGARIVRATAEAFVEACVETAKATQAPVFVLELREGGRAA